MYKYIIKKSHKEVLLSEYDYMKHVLTLVERFKVDAKVFVPFSFTKDINLPLAAVLQWDTQPIKQDSFFLK